MLEIATRFALQILRLCFATGLWCAITEFVAATFGVTQTPFVVPPSPLLPTSLRRVAVAGDKTVVVTFGVGRNHTVYREIGSVERAGVEEPVRVRIPLTPRSTWTASRQSEGFVVTGPDWWYATLDDRDEVAATTFVKSDGSRATHLKPRAPGLTPDTTDMTNSNSWQMVAIPGDTPRVLEITYTAAATIVTEVEWGGATKTWQLPPLSINHFATMVALRLADGRIALVTNHDGLSMYFLTDAGEVTTIPLRNLRVQQFDAALDGAGRIAIVAARNANLRMPSDTGTIDVAIIDPTHPDHAEWWPLRHDVRVVGTSLGVHVVPTAEGFAAAWINDLEKRRIEAADIDRRGRGGPVIEVGNASPRGDLPFLDMQAQQDAMLFWWDDGTHLIQRELPASLKGYAAIADFVAGRCESWRAMNAER